MRLKRSETWEIISRNHRRYNLCGQSIRKIQFCFNDQHYPTITGYIKLWTDDGWVPWPFQDSLFSPALPHSAYWVWTAAQVESPPEERASASACMSTQEHSHLYIYNLTWNIYIYSCNWKCSLETHFNDALNWSFIKTSLWKLECESNSIKYTSASKKKLHKVLQQQWVG